MSEREQADRWWATGETYRYGVYRIHALRADENSSDGPSRWWYALPDERAVAIYKQESGQ